MLGRRELYKKGAMFLVLALLVGQILYVCFSLTRQPEVGMGRLSQEFNLIPQMPEASPVGAVESIDKITLIGLTQNYEINKPASLVLEYYLHAAPKYGWKYISRRKAGGEEDVRFCKGNMSLAVDVIATTPSTTEYNFGVRWARSSGSPSYCR